MTASSSAIALTIKWGSFPAVHLVCENGQPVEDSAVTVLDQGTHGAAWSFDDVIWVGLMFLVSYYGARDRWPAELRAPCAGRAQGAEAS
jgi:hypothetical protein